MIEELFREKIISKEQRNVINKYRKKRNNGTHIMSIGFKELENADQIFFGEKGLFEKLNNLLE